MALARSMIAMNHVSAQSFRGVTSSGIAVRRAIHTSPSLRASNPFFNLQSLSNARETQYAAKASRLSRIDHSPNLQLLKAEAELASGSSKGDSEAIKTPNLHSSADKAKRQADLRSESQSELSTGAEASIDNPMVRARADLARKQVKLELTLMEVRRATEAVDMLRDEFCEISGQIFDALRTGPLHSVKEGIPILGSILGSMASMKLPKTREEEEAAKQRETHEAGASEPQMSNLGSWYYMISNCLLFAAGLTIGAVTGRFVYYAEHSRTVEEMFEDATGDDLTMYFDKLFKMAGKPITRADKQKAEKQAMEAEKQAKQVERRAMLSEETYADRQGMQLSPFQETYAERRNRLKNVSSESGARPTTIETPRPKALSWLW